MIFLDDLIDAIYDLKYTYGGVGAIDIILKFDIDSVDDYDMTEDGDEIRFEVGDEEYLTFNEYDDAVTKAERYVLSMMEEDPSVFREDFMHQYITVSECDARMIASEEADLVVDDMSDEDVLSQTDKEDEYEEEDDDDKKEEILDEARDEMKDTIHSEWYDGLLNDPVDFLCNQHGLYQESDLSGLIFIQTDYEKASEAAVEEDGVAHFLAGYDGEELQLGNAFWYRTN